MSTKPGQLHLALRQENPSRLDQHLFRTVCDRCTRYVAFHREYPFVTAPQQVLHVSTTSILRQFANNAPLSFTLGEEARGLIVIGSSGSGKTVLLLRIADASTKREWIFDVKRDALALAVRHPHVLVFTDDSPVDFLARPPYLNMSEHIALLTEGIARTMYVGQTGKAVLHEALTKVFEREHPTLAQLITTLDGMIHKGDTYDRVNAIRNIALRIRRLVARYPGLTAERAVPLFKLCEESVLWSFTSYTDLEDMVVTCAVLHLFHHHRAHNLREHTTTIHLDEALLAFRAENGRHINGNLLAELVGLTREYGIAWRLSVNTLTLVDPAVIANVFTIIALNVNSGSEATAVARTLGLSPEQAEYHARKLTRGQAIVRLGDRWRYPILCTYDDLPFAKTISPEAWQGVTERIKDLAAREGMRQPPTAESSALPPPRIAPTVEKSIAPNTETLTISPNLQLPPNTGQRVPLNTHAARLLGYAAQHGVVLTTIAFCDLGTHPQAGTRAKKQLLDLSFIEEERITIRRSRGSTGVAIRPTATGYAQTGVKRHGTRGGDSIQHEYLVRELARRIKNAKMDALVGKKAADLLIAYNSNDHAQLARILGITPSDGALIAIEVEVSSPDKTAPRNVEANDAAGIAHTIIATMTPLRRKTDAIGVDVFALLEAL